MKQLISFILAVCMLLAGTGNGDKSTRQGEYAISTTVHADNGEEIVVHLGQEKAEICQELEQKGIPYTLGDIGQRSVYILRYADSKSFVNVDLQFIPYQGNEILEKIDVTFGDTCTLEGLGVGDDVERLFEVYGQPSNRYDSSEFETIELYEYYENGYNLCFEVSKSDGKIWRWNLSYDLPEKRLPIDSSDNAYLVLQMTGAAVKTILDEHNYDYSMADEYILKLPDCKLYFSSRNLTEHSDFYKYEVYGSSRTTSKNVKVGDSVDSVLSAYGEPRANVTNGADICYEYLLHRDMTKDLVIGFHILDGHVNSWYVEIVNTVPDMN